MRIPRFVPAVLFRLLLVSWLAAGLLPSKATLAQEAQPAPATAAAPAPDAADPLATLNQTIDKARRQLNSFADLAGKAATDDGRLVDLKAKVDDLGRTVLKSTVSLRPRLEEISQRLTELGDPPKEGQPPEAREVTEERNRLTDERGRINAITGDAENLSVDASALANRITEMRRKLFTDTLTRRSVFTPDMLDEASAALFDEIDNLSRATTSWINFVWRVKQLQLFFAVALSLVAALVLLSGGYRMVGFMIRRQPTEPDPPYISRLSVAFWSTLLSALVLGSFLGACYFFLDTFNVLRPDIAPILSAALSVIGLVYFVWRLSHAVFSPFAPNWRLVRVSNSGARGLVAAIVAMTVVNGFDYLLSAISVALGSPVVLTVAKSLIASVVIGFILVAMTFSRPLLADDGDPDAPGKPWPRLAAGLLRFAGCGLILAALVGYVGLARFVSTQITLTGAVLVTMYIGILSGKAVSRQNSFGGTLVGQYFRRRFKLDPIGLDQLGLAAGFGIYLLALLTGIPLILLSWGFQVRDLQLWAYRLFTEITIGNISISLVGILSGVLLFVAGLFGTRWFQRWLDGSIMARSHVDAGVRNSVKTGVGYLGVALAGLIGISAAGIDLSSLALVAGALSLGIGFGLQNIVSNFVSGLILLVERPFKVGDWVVTGTTEGFVRRISVRATEIETFQHQSIIVPNSELINASVGNWTHRNRLGRVEIPVSVSYDSEPHEVMQILLDLANSHPLVLHNPEPSVAFMAFGPFSLDFELRLYLADLFNGTQVRNDIRIGILEKFKEKGIVIPMPQRNLNVTLEGEGGLIEKVLAAEAKGGEEVHGRDRIAGRGRAAAAKADADGDAGHENPSPEGADRDRNKA
ncbi:mechanosensitive ion channel family protein [Gellertiella hungarica]|uniref:Small-conductance mechanosensitive channel n=1 Tax=Gellertiella hungarica TaxID=1572859 RepID=A0A7W6J9A6_9HYPH|nr:mechanosensitive ion channel family protein [Gellertiella hungarica]MBB4067185.1 small-conductance mechanosensitive channel [Gellertiella hungarica]